MILNVSVMWQVVIKDARIKLTEKVISAKLEKVGGLIFVEDIFLKCGRKIKDYGLGVLQNIER